MMLYGSVTMGSCYLVASMCLKTMESHPSQERMVGDSRPHEARQFGLRIHSSGE
jgi:hypothetical protein